MHREPTAPVRCVQGKWYGEEDKREGSHTMLNAHIPTSGERAAMWANNVSFCPEMFGRLTPTAVSQLLANQVFSANSDFAELLRARYEKMSTNFMNVPHPDVGWEQCFSGETCQTVACHCKPDARLAVPTRCILSSDGRITRLFNEPNFGLDLPVWFCRRDAGENMPRVMFVAQDPLRTDPRNKYLYISSPWAFHSRDFREKEKNSIPSLLVDCLLSQGCCLYLTDAAKIFAKDHDYANRYIQPAFAQKFNSVLREEISQFNPDVIVAVGEPASRVVLQLGGQPEIRDWNQNVLTRPQVNGITVGNSNISCVSASHFSGITRHLAQLRDAYEFGNMDGNEKYVVYYVEAINSALHRNNID